MSKINQISAAIFQSSILKTKVLPRPSPSLFYFPGLNTKEIFDPESFSFTNELKRLYPVILSEYNALRKEFPTSDYNVSENKEHKLHEGKWDWNSYILKGKRQADFAVKCPKTVEFLESLENPGLMTGTPFSFTFFSTLHKKSTISPHNGPCNLRVRCHFPLIVPEGDCGMQVGSKKITWKEGIPVFFDDCYEHHVWNNTDEDRVLLLFDVWHPDLHKDEITAIIEMFDEAKRQGWLS